MGERLNKVLGINEDFKEIRKDIHELSFEINSLKASVRKQSAFMKAAQEEILGLVREARSELASSKRGIKSSLVELETELASFKVIRSQTQKRIMDAFRTEISGLSSQVKTDVTAYNKLKNEIGAVSNYLHKAAEDIRKFTDISKELKASDFSLSRFDSAIDKREREKIRLLKRIDQLERVIARERRK